MRILLASVALVAFAVPASAQQAPVPTVAVQASPELQRRIGQLIDLINGGGDYAATFSPAFIGAVPKPAFDAFAKHLAATNGKAVRIGSVTPQNPWVAAVMIVCERGSARAEIAVDPSGQQQVTGLRIVGDAPEG